MIKVATAFSGGLAACEFALRYENIENEVVFACELDKYARKQYAHFHGEPKTFYKDIRNLNATKYLNEIDLFVWGSPCQDLSLAGKRKGFDGEKSSLFREGARVMSEMMTKAFIFENVKGLLSSNSGNDFKEVINTFNKLGYNCTFKVLNTKDYGIPQNRERVFIVGFLDHSKHISFEFEPTIKLELKLKDLLESEVDEKYFLSEKIIHNFITRKQSKNYPFQPKDGNDIASCLTAGYFKMAATNNYIKVKSNTSQGYEIATPNDSINFTNPNSKTRQGRVGKEVAQTLDCACNQGVIENYRIRKLTPRECFRLQGVKDDDIDLVVSNTQAYKIAGNAISVNVIQSILRSIYKNKSQNLFSF